MRSSTRNRIRTYVFRRGCTCVDVAEAGAEVAAGSLDAAGCVVITVVEKCFELGTREREGIEGDGAGCEDAAAAAPDCAVDAVVAVCALLARKRDAEWFEK